MATNTTNLSLTNPEYGKGEKYNLALWVDNNNKIDAAVGNRVEKEVGKVLSTNDYTDLEKQKLNTDIPAQLGEKVNSVNGVLPDVNGNVAIDAGGAAIDDAVTALDKAWSSTKIDTTKANKAQENWIIPTLLNGFTQFSSYAVGYRKDSLGRVYFRGAVNGNTTAGAIVCTLPVGYRPSSQEIALVGYGTGTAITIGLSVLSNGDVKISKPNGSTIFFLDAISFATT